MVEFILRIDNIILELIRTDLRSGLMNQIMPAITRLGNGGAVWICVALLFLLSRKYRNHGLYLIAALLLCLLVGNLTLKPLVARIRPYDLNTLVTLLIPRPTNFSFPSGHAMSAFAAATVIFHANRKMGMGAFLLAALIAFSRLYLYVHYPSDVLAGMLIGILIGVAATRICRALLAKTRAA